MFTGLIEKTGVVNKWSGSGSTRALTITHEPWCDLLKPGESVAVSGACLTVITVKNREFACNVLDETLKRTNLGKKTCGAVVNLERAMKCDGRLGGHIVTGHVDGLGNVIAVKRVGADLAIRVACDDAVMAGIVEKGSVACDGISLTVAGVKPGSFEVRIIDFTLAHTSLASAAAGELVNIETDILGKYVRSFITRRGQDSGDGITMKALADGGFV